MPVPRWGILEQDNRHTCIQPRSFNPVTDFGKASPPSESDRGVIEVTDPALSFADYAPGLPRTDLFVRSDPAADAAAFLDVSSPELGGACAAFSFCD